MAGQASETRAEPPAWWGRPLAETRWMLELARLLADPVFVSQSGVPRGDGRPVVLLPGFLAGDRTLSIMAGGSSEALGGGTFNSGVLRGERASESPPCSKPDSLDE